MGVTNVEDPKSWNDGTAEKNPKFKKMEWQNGGKNPNPKTESRNGRKTPKTLEDGMTENQPKSKKKEV